MLVPLAKMLSPTRVGMQLQGVGADSIVYYVTHWPVIMVAANVAGVIALLSQWWIVLPALLVAGWGVPRLVLVARGRWPMIGYLYVWGRATAKPVRRD